ncbi:MAG TPA: prepilin-type N-terminal cleavage/methylation domain-containing protein [Aridibacter sp.]|nr:prepilin-type N-terminal cleavage/methylation domain-containing protein [Aridibacter sp.]
MSDDIRNIKRAGQAGFSLPELLMVTIVIAVVSALAIYQFTAPKVQFSRQNVSRELKVALERARFDSVKRRADDANSYARVVITSTSYTLGTDRDLDGDVDSNDDVVKSFSGTGITITGAGLTFPVTVVYDKRGEVLATDAGGNPVNPVFRICNGDCSTPTNGNSDLLVVTPTGTVNLLGGASSESVFSPPPVTVVSGSTDVNPLTTVPGS